MDNSFRYLSILVTKFVSYVTITLRNTSVLDFRLQANNHYITMTSIDAV